MNNEVSAHASLLEAAAAGDVGSIQSCIERGVDVNAADAGGATALRMAAGNGHVEAVQFLVEKGADVNEGGRYRWRPLLWAAGHGHLGAVDYLLHHGANANAADEDGWTPLLWAAMNGHAEVVQCLVDGGAEVNASDEGGGAPLHRAAGGGHVEVVRYLVGHGAVVDERDEEGRTPLREAADGGHLPVVWYLMERGADQASPTGEWTLLRWAASSGHSDIVKHLVESGADVNVVDGNGDTALHRAADCGHFTIAKYLVEAGADVNAIDKNERVPLLLAARRGYLELAKYLASYTASTAISASAGRMALDDAERNGFTDIRQLLLRHLQATSPAVEPRRLARATRWFISPFEIEAHRADGTGSIGGDFVATWLDTSVVIKLFVTVNSRLEDEIEQWSKLLHPNVQMLYGACTIGHPFFVCEFASQGSVVEFLRRCEPKVRRPWRFMRDAALGLQYLHERNVLHRDLRGSNILVGDDGMAKLADFKLGRFTGRSLARQSTGEYVRWASPELLKGEELTPASDIYSLGMCIVEAVTGKRPYPDDEARLVVRMKEHHEADSLFRSRHAESFSEDEWQLISRMCASTPTARISMAFVVHTLEQLAYRRDSQAQHSREPDPDPLLDGDIDLYIDLLESKDPVSVLWGDICALLGQSPDQMFAPMFDSLHVVYSHVMQADPEVAVLMKFCRLLQDFHDLIQHNSTQSRIQRLSCTRANVSSLSSLRRRIRLIREMLETPSQEREVVDSDENLDQQRVLQTTMFMSELSDSYLILNELESTQDRAAFLSFLRSEIDKHSANYSESQLAVMEKAFTNIAAQSEVDVMPGTAPPWFIPWYELIIDEFQRIGEGGYGNVCKAKWLDSDVVVKQMLVDENAAKRREMRAMFEREVSIWFRLNHPHVVRLFGACHVGTPFFVSEFATKGTLNKYLTKHPDEIWLKLAEAARGVEYLHARGVIHGDLKCNNILIGRDGKAKVTDFGLSSLTSQAGDKASSGAERWLAPECLLYGGSWMSTASDIYSLGMCVVESLLVVEKARIPVPWGNIQDGAAVVRQVKNKQLPRRPTKCTDQQWSLVERMCTFNPQDRLSILTVVEELDRLRNGTSDAQSKPQLNELSTSDSVDGMTEQLQRMIQLEGSAHYGVSVRVYDLLVERIRHAQTVLGLQQELRPILQNALARLTALIDHNDQSFVGESVNAFSAYSLHRQLDKLLAARMLLPAVESEPIHNWQAKCYELLEAETALDLK